MRNILSLSIGFMSRWVGSSFGRILKILLIGFYVLFLLNSLSPLLRPEVAILERIRKDPDYKAYLQRLSDDFRKSERAIDRSLYPIAPLNVVVEAGVWITVAKQTPRIGFDETLVETNEYLYRGLRIGRIILFSGGLLVLITLTFSITSPRRVSVGTVLKLLITGFYVLFFLYALSPLLSSRHAILGKIRNDLSYKEHIQRLLEDFNGNEKEKKRFLYRIPIAAAVDAEVWITADMRQGGKPWIDSESLYFGIRTDRVILFSGGLLVLLTLAFYIDPARPAKLGVVRPGFHDSARPTTLELTGDKVPTSAGKEDAEEQGNQSKTAEAALEREVQGAYDRAADVYVRSTVLLICGIVMAFVGVGVFYVTLPESPEPGQTHFVVNYLSKAFRPTGVLIFVEAAAWFLLRQYRALVEDYKWFYRVYLKRANYLVAYKLIENHDDEKNLLFLTATLLTEDLSGRLSRGESTESLEAQKAIDPNPVIGLLEKIVGQQRAGN